MRVQPHVIEQVHGHGTDQHSNPHSVLTQILLTMKMRYLTFSLLMTPPSLQDLWWTALDCTNNLRGMMVILNGSKYGQHLDHVITMETMVHTVYVFLTALTGLSVPACQGMNPSLSEMVLRDV